MKLVLLIAVGACLSPAIANADEPSGAWKFEGPKGGTAMTCKLSRSGANIAGSCVTPQGSTVEATGTVSGDQVEIGYNAAGSPLRVTFRGVIQPDGTMKGSVSASTPPTPFTATKQ